MPETSIDFASSARLLKSKVTLRQVMESYGIKLSGRHIPCPLHTENTPSFKVYQEDTENGNFYCYGCQKHGDLISFVAFKESCTSGQALFKLSKLFNIDLATKENMPNMLVDSLSIILGKRQKEIPKDISELVHWQVLSEKVSREFDSMNKEMVPYLINKKLPHIGTKSKYNILIVPMYDLEGRMWSFQQIHSDGTKMFLKDSKKKDLMLRLGEPDQKFSYICEGWATGASVFLSTGKTTHVSFSSNNIDSVADQLKNKYAGIEIVVAGDNDEAGRHHHQKAIYPEKYKTDWSDVFMELGPEKLKSILLSSKVGV